jgi:MFS family permease
MPFEPPANDRHDPYAAFRVAGYRRYAIGYFVSVLGRAAVAAAVGYELFHRTRSATILGLVGLVGALPVILFALPAGHLADRWNRKAILMTTQAISAVCSLALCVLSRWHDRVPGWPWLTEASNALVFVAHRFGEEHAANFSPTVPLMLLVLGVNACARAFGWAARGAFVPNLVPRELLPNAVTWNSSLSQISSTVGAMGAGVLISFIGLPATYALDVVCALLFLGFIGGVKYEQDLVREVHATIREEVFSGLRFVWNAKVILGAITLDLFAVLIGGAIALLPIFADILNVGAVGFGWLRAAPSMGALIMGFTLAHLPLMKRAGLAMLWSVAGFGFATMIFGLSKNYALSFVALAMTGALDNVSVVVRHSLVQMMTPDSMRGRVSAVNNVFINSSNELGQLESGLTAAMFGPVWSVVGGGIGVIIVVLLVAWRIPQVRRIGSLRELSPHGPSSSAQSENALL